METHPAAEIFPLMAKDDFASLVENIAKHGLQEPIVLLDGQILDGRNRYKACIEAGQEPKFEDWKMNGMTPENYVISKNLHRRHLTVSQKAAIAAKMANRKDGRTWAQRLTGSGEPVKTNEEAAAICGVSAASVKRAKAIYTRGTQEQIAAMEKGESALRSIANSLPKEGAANGSSNSDIGTPRLNGRTRVNVPDGETLESMIRRGIASGHYDSTKCAKEAGLAQQTFRKGCDVVWLADRTNLREDEKELAQTALRIMNETKQVWAAHELIEGLAKSIWGSLKGTDRARAEAKQLEKFEVSIVQFETICRVLSDIQFPYLNDEKIIDLSVLVKQAMKDAKAFQCKFEEKYL